jgi:hypothetical protein
MKNKVPRCQKPPEIPLNPPFSKGETIPLPLLKGGWEGFLRWLNKYEIPNIPSMGAES